MRYISIVEQLRRERAENIKLKEQTERNAADLDYIAMMCGVELDDPEDGEEMSEGE